MLDKYMNDKNINKHRNFSILLGTNKAGVEVVEV